MFINNILSLCPPVPSAAQMREWDADTIRFGVSGLSLMESAGGVVVEEIIRQHGSVRGKNVWIFAGKGNNGGDSARVARELRDLRANPTLFCAAMPGDYKGDAKTQIDLALRDETPYVILERDRRPEDIFYDRLRDGGVPALIVDGILGTGFKGELKPETRELIEALNAFAGSLGTPVVSIDVPSGLDADLGLPSPVAVKASLTVTLAAAKPGLLTLGAAPFRGRVYVKRIGMPLSRAQYRPSSLKVLDGRVILNAEPLPANSYKNKYGHVLVVGGAEGMTGAARIAALASLRAGAGLLTVCAPASCLPEIKIGAPEIMAFNPGENWPRRLSGDLGRLIGACSAIVAGPGLNRTPEAGDFLASVLAFPGRPPAVIDADALHHFGENPGLFQFLTSRDILTPHPGEAAGLLKTSSAQIQGDRRDALERLLQMTSATVILKGAGTLLGQKNREFAIICPYDVPQLAIAGAGDALAGVLGAFMAARPGEDSLALAAHGVLRHALAGYFLGRELPERGALAADLVNMLPRVRKLLLAEPRDELESGLMPWPSIN